MECSQAIEIDAGDWVNAMTFTANGEYLVSGGLGGIQVWRVKDGERVATMNVEDIRCVAVSKDGRFIAAGSYWGNVLVWDATTYEHVLADEIPGGPFIWDVDFSPDSMRLVSADYETCTATIWDVTARKKVQTLDHGRPVLAAKYSPQGDRIATATDESVRVWGSDDGHLLVDVKVELKPWRGLLWFNDHLLVKTKDSKIRQIDASTGSTVSEWSVPHDDDPCIALPQHGKFIACSTKDTVSFWDTLTQTQLGLTPRSSEIRSIAFSSNDQLAIVAQERRIIIQDLTFIIGPGIRIQSAALHAWKNDQLTKADELLTTIPTSNHHALASRALVRARLQQWDAALVDAEESIEIQSTTFGYIAKCVALVGRGGAHAGCRACDTASLLFHPDLVAILLLVKAIALFMAGEHDEAISRVEDLIAIRSLNPTFYVVQAYMHVLRGNLYLESGDYNRAIQSFENARVKLGNRKEQPLLIITLISGWKFDDLAITIQQRSCEALFVANRTKEAGESVLHMMGGEINVSESTKTWITDFIQRCLSAPEKDHNTSPATVGPNSTSHHMLPLLKEWAKLRLTTGLWKDALIAATGFMLPRFTIYQTVCEHLETTGHVADAVACFHQMCSELEQDVDGEQVNWIRNFKSRYRRKLEDLGDIAMGNKEYDEAISQYTIALSLEPASMQELLVKRSTARVSKGEWDDALKDANEVIKVDPGSPLGYERRHAALHCKGDHEDAIAAYETMLLKMSESTDPKIREQSCRYVSPEVKRATIRATIEDTTRDSPLVLIDTIHGHLCDKSKQTSTFEKTPTFMELVSSMTTNIDHARIKKKVGEYFRYATFSHKWEDNEPLFEKVIQVVVFDLEATPAHEKLQMFCKLVREAGFSWAWSDTCCINKGDHFVLQEALVSMFKWYERSAMTLIFLRGVDRLAKRGALTRNIWNMRAWTLQEYHASKVVRIYTEDWTPYLGLEIYNHKEAPEIISEMEEATGISAPALMALRPGLDDIREKLRLASTRQSTRVEDAAYSLLGIFSMTLPVTYGEGDKALGRLLSQLLTSSGDVSILAWTGGSGSFNSCLPSNITVFRHPPTSHIPAPSAISDTEMGTISTEIRSLGLSTAVADLYDRLSGLSVPWFVDRRMKFPCLIFKLGQGQVLVSQKEHVFRARTYALGVVEIKTDEDLSQLGPLYLVHPWIEFLLDHQLVDSAPDQQSSVVSPSSTVSATVRLFDRLGLAFGGRTAASAQNSPLSTTLAGRQSVISTPDAVSLLPPSTVSPSEKQMRILQFIARLRQPFGALLLAPTRRNMNEYRRVAAESLIRVQVKEITPEILDKLIQSVRVLDVL